MSLGAPKVNAPAPAPAQPSQGADALKLGGDTLLRARGGIGRLALRVPGATTPGTPLGQA